MNRPYLVIDNQGTKWDYHLTQAGALKHAKMLNEKWADLGSSRRATVAYEINGGVQ